VSISYNKLWKLLIDKGWNKTTLRNAGIHPTSIAKMGRNERVTLEVLENLCKLLNCDIGDIIEYVPDNSDSASH